LDGWLRNSATGGADHGDRTIQSDSAVVVFAAASATNALDEVRAAFAKNTGAEVLTSCAATSTLAQQIVSGAEADSSSRPT